MLANAVGATDKMTHAHTIMAFARSDEISSVQSWVLFHPKNGFIRYRSVNFVTCFDVNLSHWLHQNTFVREITVDFSVEIPLTLF